MNPEAEQRAQRGAFLSVVLTGLGSSVFLFFLFLACGGLWIYVVAVLGGIALFGFVHYLLWGHAMTNQVSAEAKEHEAREERADDIPDRLEARDWTPEERSWYRRF
jgi:hypothetical protein